MTKYKSVGEMHVARMEPGALAEYITGLLRMIDDEESKLGVAVEALKVAEYAMTHGNSNIGFAVDAVNDAVTVVIAVGLRGSLHRAEGTHK